MKIHLYVTKPGKKWYQCSTYISCHGKSTTQSRITVQLAVHCTGSTAQMMVMACQRQLSQQLVRTYFSTNELHIQSPKAYLVPRLHSEDTVTYSQFQLKPCPLKLNTFKSRIFCPYIKIAMFLPSKSELLYLTSLHSNFIMSIVYLHYTKRVASKAQVQVV